MVKAIVGGNWGDEGKGKITDMLAEEADVVVRFQGGSNAGHTIINQFGKFALHQLPSGIFHEKTINIMGNGVALNVEYLLEEIDKVKFAKKNFNLMISNRAQIILPHHILFDKYEEERLGDRMFGSTKSGIAPFYADKYSKNGIQLWQIYYDDDLKEKLKFLYEKVNIVLKQLYNKDTVDYLEVYDILQKNGQVIEQYVSDTSLFLKEAIKENKNILLEGQLGALKDIDHGIYPFVTSSSTLAGYSAIGAGISPRDIKDIIVITKAYSTAVGEGPFVSEVFGEEAEKLRNSGGDAGEYGATTGRPRRVGYFDIVATRYGCEIQGATELIVTGLDVLEYMEEIPVCVAYEINGKVTEEFLPTTLLYKAKPVIKKLPGFKCNIRGIKEFDKLPENAKGYILFLEEKLGVKITMVSNGPKREEIIIK